MARAPSLKTRLFGIADTVGKRKDGLFQAKRTYFYRHGMTSEKFAARVQAAIPEAEIVLSGDHFAQWPSQSYFYARFKMPEEPSTENQVAPEQVA